MISIRSLCKDFELKELKLKRHVSAIALKNELKYLGLSTNTLDFLTFPNDFLEIFEFFSEYAFERSSERMYDIKCRKDPLFKNTKVIFLKRLKRTKKNIWAIVG